jgi:hypothetical protein
MTSSTPSIELPDCNATTNTPLSELSDYNATSSMPSLGLPNENITFANGLKKCRHYQEHMKM